ncbi:hypothetical protein TNCV_869401, partial [Trichonephila clavipes]
MPLLGMKAVKGTVDPKRSAAPCNRACAGYASWADDQFVGTPTSPPVYRNPREGIADERCNIPQDQIDNLIKAQHAQCV